MLKDDMKFAKEVRMVGGSFFRVRVGTKAMQGCYEMYFPCNRLMPQNSGNYLLEFVNMPDFLNSLSLVHNIHLPDFPSLELMYVFILTQRS